ncbi:signal peptidase I [Actinacidiphila guanduensis]|uniref:Signal peptidase I n=1 Tax=Actinacidiphila guanduensis TaxID=310781 RepID=A0A1H0FT74_9ACTN|nr:signal peptidase I Serine peptidase. MEROPS family S26A [Actinacidiphila guanduensis]
MDGAAQAGGGPAAEASGPAGTDAGAPEEDGAAGQQGASGHRGGRGRRRRAPRERGGGRPQRPLWKELPVLVVVALVLALIVKTFLLQAFSIPSESMQNTLQPGDRVLVDKLTPWFGSKPERGDVVVFHDPADWLGDEEAPHPNVIQKALGFIGLMPAAGERDLIKRVIGVAGDTVECQGTGPVKVNGRPLDEPYLMPGNTPCTEDGQGGQFKVTVPKGTIWVMGDHRQNSLDSRYHQQDTTHGFVPVGNVVGRAVVVAWPLDRWSTLPVPHTFSQPGISAAAATAPTAVGVAGAVPLVLWRRRRKL